MVRDNKDDDGNDDDELDVSVHISQLSTCITYFGILIEIIKQQSNHHIT